ncbi:hypothetical protein [Enterococcus rivorum]|uniref:Uncharacterized protein n=1 Tax=Enterococcus rivorum TaxID=762845 RepID=A0A1E5KUV6_9ENTE|nr:hypothetical protein [Enterococcus rivorum]MBP2099095.1 hypothetical protein [Enterococcus rivorum]OEH81652.1 hypothetical protein BCR26_15920 [Enterococcus rivorum]
MNYEQRISALEQFKSSISNGTIEDNASSFSENVSGWKGGTAKDKYKTYISKVKKETSKAVTKRAAFLSKVDERIAYVQAKFNAEYQSYSAYFIGISDVDPIKDKQKKRIKLNGMSMDESVRNKIRRNFML